MSRRILSVLLSVLLIMSSFSFTVYAESEPVLSFGEPVISEDSVLVPVVLSALPVGSDLAALTMKYTYSADKLVYQGIEDAAIAVGDDQHDAGVVSWYDAENPLNSVADTIMFSLSFAKATGAAGDVSINANVVEIASSEMKGYELAAASTTFDLDPIVPAVVSMEAAVTDGVVEIPVSIDKIPDELDGDMAAITYVYSYDTNVLSYKETKAGAVPVDESTSVAGKVSWYSMEAPVTAVDSPLFTLVFDVIDTTAENTSVSVSAVELADSKFNRTTEIIADAVSIDLQPAPVYENATIALGDAIIEDRTIKVPVTLDKVPDDIADLASVTLRYSYDKAAMTYAGCESGVIDITDAATDEHISWYSGEAITKEDISDSVLFTLVFEASETYSGDTTVAITVAELGCSEMKKSNYVVTKDVTFEIPAPVIESNAKITFGPEETDEFGAIRIPVSIDKIPEDLVDISAVTFEYGYDANKITYTGIENGLLNVVEGEDIYAAQGVVSWFSTTPVTEAGVLFTLLFDTVIDAEGETTLTSNFIEVGDSKFVYSELIEGEDYTFTLPDLTVLVSIDVVPTSMDIQPRIWNDNAQIKAFVEENITSITANYKKADGTEFSEPVTEDYTVVIAADGEGKKAVVTFEEVSAEIALVQEAKKLTGITVEPVALEVAPRIWNDDAAVKAFVEGEINSVIASYSNADDEEVTGYTVAIEADGEGKKAVVTYETASAEITLTQEAKKLTGIEVDPTALDVAPKIWNDDVQVKAFVEGEIKTVTAKYSNADDEVVASYTVAIEADGEGKKAVVAYETATANIALTQEAKDLVGIEVDVTALEVAPKIWNDDAAVKAFVEGEIKTVTAKYSNADDEVVTGYTVAIEADGENRKAVVTYGTASAEITLTQEAKKLTEIEVDPTALEVAPKIWNDDTAVKAFVEGEIKTVTAKYSNADDEVVTSYTVAIEADGENKKAVVTYETVSANIALTQEAKALTEIVVDPTALEVAPKIWNDDTAVKAFVEGKITTVTAKYSNADDEVVTGYTVAIEADGEGKKAVVTYAEKTADITLTQEAKALTEIEVDPTALEVAPKIWNDDTAVKTFVEGEIKTVTAKYSNADDEAVTGYTVAIEPDGENKKAVVTYETVSANIALTQEAKALTEIVVDPTALEVAPKIWNDDTAVKAFVEGEIKTVTAKYSNADDEVVTGYTVAIEADGEGKKAVVTYAEKTADITLTQEAKALTEIEVDPTALEVAPKIWNDDTAVKAFVEGEIKTVTAKYSNADDEVVTGYIVAIEADGENKKAVVTYEGKTAEITLAQEAKDFTEIVVDPTSLEVAPKIWNDDAAVKAFVEGEIKTVTAKYSNADDEVVTGYTVAIEADGENKKAVVTYEGKTAEIALAQAAKVLSEITINPAELEISPAIWDDNTAVESYVGKNIEVTAKYTNADDEIVEEYTIAIVADGEGKKAEITYGEKTVAVALTRGLYTIDYVMPVYNLENHRAWVITMYADGVPYVDGEVAVRISDKQFVFVTEATEPVITVAEDETADLVEWGKLHRADKVTALDALMAINAANGVIADAFKVHDNVYIKADVIFDYEINANDALAINNISLGKATTFRVAE